MKTLIVIPSRYASTRFPQKPLHLIGGQSLLSRVADIARICAERHANVSYVVATDHAAIESHAREIGAPVVMTDPDLPSGTDRALAAANAVAPEAEFIVNLQGDAPFTPPSYISAVIEAGAATALDAVTPIVQMSWDDLDEVRERKKETPFSGTSCIVNAQDEALWFSKNILPAIRKETQLRETAALSPVWRHIGLYGYKRDALERFVSLPEGHYERLEGLEQLRFLENGMRIQAVKVAASASAMWGIDTPQDAAHAEALIAQHGEPLAEYSK
ncbi:MAG: 3-deoxy-manno-octulosonate cytidylyltransferase [Hyphomonadaceae bacterium]|nr:3-deoxy-manno-octulosonate cytidylyltransferase [Hyphomonadaceae bacterium]